MNRGIAHWTRRRLVAAWIAGFVVEVALIGVAAIFLETPTPDLVAQLDNEPPAVTSMIIRADVDTLGGEKLPPRMDLSAPPRSFHTVLHWPLSKPLLEGGGRVVSLPMHLWWLPALYVLGVPLLLIALTIYWSLSRRRLLRTTTADFK